MSEGQGRAQSSGTLLVLLARQPKPLFKSWLCHLAAEDSLHVGDFTPRLLWVHLQSGTVIVTVSAGRTSLHEVLQEEC